MTTLRRVELWTLPRDTVVIFSGQEWRVGDLGGSVIELVGITRRSVTWAPTHTIVEIEEAENDRP